MITEYTLSDNEIHEIKKMIDLYPDDAVSQIVDTWCDDNINGMLSEDCFDSVLDQIL